MNSLLVYAAQFDERGPYRSCDAPCTLHRFTSLAARNKWLRQNPRRRNPDDPTAPPVGGRWPVVGWIWACAPRKDIPLPLKETP